MVKIGIIGASGAVGLEMLKVMAEKNIQIAELRLFASEKTAGKKITYLNEEITIELVKEDSFKGLDFVLGATSNELAIRYAPLIKASNAIFIDNSSAFRMNEDVPLVVAEINGEDVFKNQGIIANPNCSTIISMIAINSLNKLSKIKGIYAATYQAVSGAGLAGIKELKEEIEALNNNEKFQVKTFDKQIAYNCLPKIGSKEANLYTSEEMKMQNEGRKILHLPDLLVSCTCVRVPVLRSHAISLNVILEDELDLDLIRGQIAKAKGVKLVDNIDHAIYPNPLEASNQDLVMVGRIRKDLVNPKGINLFCVGDQIRKGAATNAVQIMELLMNK